MRRPEDYILCETSEEKEHLISKNDLIMMKVEIANRIIEVFGYQSLSAIIFRLHSTKHELKPVLNGEEFPSTELLFGIHQITGASIDWILTGSGPKLLSSQILTGSTRVVHAADRFRPAKRSYHKQTG